MSLSFKKGFTLVELLIVIAILGTLAVVVLIALNPVQQLARTRDSGRISTVSQLGHAVEAFATVNNGIYPVQNNTWITQLVNSGEIAVIPSAASYNIAGTGPCTTNVQPPNGYCYLTTGGAGSGTGPVMIFARLEASSNIQRCTNQFAGTNRAYAYYRTAEGRGGIICTNGVEPPLTGGSVIPL